MNLATLTTDELVAEANRSAYAFANSTVLQLSLTHADLAAVRTEIDRRGWEPDAYARYWPNVTDNERCRTCGQPDNCGDCNHRVLRPADVVLLGGVL